MLSSDPIVTVDTNYGTFQIELLPSAAPQTVANFLSYVDSGAYTNTIFHRSVPGFVEQAGGFTSSSDTFTSTSQFTSIPTNAAIPLEYSVPNTVGTVAMARTSSPNSATDQWFVNLADNSTSLGPGGSSPDGYAVFGKVLGNGMSVLNAIAQLQVNNEDNGGVYSQLPLGANNQLVRVNSITVDSIDGTVFNDANGNGTMDSGEQGVAGRTVFLDVDGTGVPDSNNPSTTTDANGNYTFSGLTAGTYTVREVLPSGVTLSTGTHTVTVAADQTASAVDFGETVAPGSTGSIYGTVFEDVNVNGKLDPGEQGLAGRTVFLNVDGTGVADSNNPSTTTDASGSYSFTGLTPGSYTVMESISAYHGVTLTTSAQTVALTAGLSKTGVDFGNALTSTILPIQVSTIGPVASTDPNTAYINAVFQSILGHAPDPTGLAYWQQQMASGASRTTVAQSVWDSAEHRGLQVEQFYQQFLGRQSDPQGKAYWMSAFNSWGTEQIEVAGFVTSQEYMTLHSGNTNFVDALYNDIALRTPDSAGTSHWTSQLAGGAKPVDVAFSFIYGKEASTALVNSLYSSFLHRAPDSANLQKWVNALDTRALTADQVAVQILASDEYFKTVTSNQAPAITSAASASFTEGSASTFAISTTGSPTASITESGALPSGMSFLDNGDGTATISGTPAVGSAGSYSVTLTASNGISPVATQTLALTVNAVTTAPSISTVAATAFAENVASTFTVKTTGAPNATLTESGTLPSGVTFSDNGDGTATLAGTPAASSNGTYNLTITASNGVSPDATQNFVLTVSATSAAPTITSATTASFTEGAAGTFTVTTSGSPDAAITESGALPTGVTLVDNQDGTATLSGTPAAGTTGTYSLTIAASNGVSPDASQTLTLTVNAAAAPTITSAAATAFAEGANSSFTVNTTGAPNATITESGTLPSGVTLTDNGDGTATLSGTPAASSNGTYNFTITAGNGVSPVATQAFTLTVSATTAAPAITSNAATAFAEGSVGTFTVTTTGSPDATITETGSLPAGVTFVNNQDGTATLSGTPAAGTSGTYSLAITANNGVSSAATQNFTLTINSAPSITTGASTTFAEGVASSFIVNTSGSPNAAITESGTLPSGVTFVDNGDGTATISGTPAASSNGTYTLTITADNGVSPSATQNFTLTVNAATSAPAITSAAATAFAEGSASSFTIQTTGSPDAVITETGSLPAGVSFVNNQDGTATISGTPQAGSAGTYSLTITASNGVSSDATQTFTLTVNAVTATPSITSSDHTAFAEGSSSSFTVKTTGSPNATITESGNLPAGVTFVDNQDGTATISGTPAASSASTYTLTITASNGVSPDATQTFTLTVNATTTAPAITSPANAAFGEGTPSTFSITTTGSPDAAITESGSLPTGVTFVDNQDGTATLSGTPAAGTGGVYSLTITASNGVSSDATQTLTLTVNVAPSITSTNNTAFTAGAAGSFTIQTSGYPAIAISTSDSLPTGVTLVDNGDGTATLTSTTATPAGTYSFTINAANGVNPNASQAFTLTVQAAPVIASADTETFTAGTAGSFSVQTSGYPVAAISTADTLPTGVSLTDNADGTATLASTAATPAGVYTIHIDASNGVSPDATQTFTLTVQGPPTIASADNATFTAGTAQNFTVQTTGGPIPTISTADTLPTGVTLVDNGDGTATLASTAATPAGVYTIHIDASNGNSPDAAQTFTLTVESAPAITSADNTTFTAGTAGSFTVQTSGVPTVAISTADTLPTGVTLVDNGNGTATLASTAATPAGVYTIHIDASNGVSPDATQTFTLTVEGPPTITSADNTTFTAGTAGNFIVQTTGGPIPTISTADTLPTGVTLVDNGDGTATLASTAAAAAGTYTIHIDATNGNSPDAAQTFTLTIS